MTTKYTITHIKLLAEKINSIFDTKLLKKIKKIILIHNKNIEFTKNINGLFARFQNLNVQTYIDIEKAINKYERSKIKKICTTDDLSILSTSSSDINKQTTKKYRLTNTETHILNRTRYEKQLRKNEFNEEDDELYPDYLLNKNSEDIFIKKSSGEHDGNHKVNNKQKINNKRKVNIKQKNKKIQK